MLYLKNLKCHFDFNTRDEWMAIKFLKEFKAKPKCLYR